MHRRAAVILAIMAVVALCLPAEGRAEEPVADAAASYAFIDAIGSGASYHAGWLGSAAVYPSGFWGIAAEAGGSYDSSGSETVRIYNLMAGPRIALPTGSIAPYAQVLLGDVRVSRAARDNTDSFGWQAGAGVDVAVSRTFAIRPQADVRWAHSGSIKQLRLAIGVVLRRWN